MKGLVLPLLLENSMTCCSFQLIVNDEVESQAELEESERCLAKIVKVYASNYDSDSDSVAGEKPGGGGVL